MSGLIPSDTQGFYIPDYSLATAIPRVPRVTPPTPMPGSDYPIFNQSPAYTGQGLSAPSEGFWSKGSDYSSLSSYGKSPGGFDDLGLGFNIPTGKLLFNGLGTLGQLWTGFQGAKLAKKSFEHTRDITNANLNNQISSYNTALEDRARARFVGEGRGENSAQEREYVARNRLTR
mgnify:FL=1